jgi:phage terminase large subunit
VPTLEVSTGYAPRPLQSAIHRSLRRFNVLVCHRRFGKTVLCVNELIDQALRSNKPRPRYAYLAPLYKQAKSVAWDYLKHFTRAIPGVKAHETELRVDLPGDRRIQLYGADNYDALRGIYLDGAVLDEYAQMAPKAWAEVIRPALADREGFAVFIGTPKGRNAFCELYEGARDGFKQPDGALLRDPEWYAALYRASQTRLLPDEELASARQQMSDEEYAQEFECSFEAAIVGAYYGKLIADLDRDGRLTRVPWSPQLPVITAWDLGVDDATAIWFAQVAGGEVRVIDYYEASGVGFDHYAKVLKEKPYVYGDHLLPHDVEVTEIGTGRSRYATLASLGIKGRVVPLAKVEDGINAARNLLPRCVFDAAKAAKGLECLRQYRRDWDETLQTFKPRPRHDWASHGADAFRYLAMGLRPAPKKSDLTPKGRPTSGGWLGA